MSLPGVNVLIEAPAGTGKTYSIGTLVESGLEVFYLATEPGMESLLGYWSDRGKEIPPNLHWHYLAPQLASFETQIKTAKLFNTLTYEALAKLQDPERSKYNYFIQLLEALNNFKDQRTGKEFGPVDKWDTDKVLVVDSLTGINKAALDLVVGGKPIKAPGEWYAAQEQLERLLRQLTDGCRCHFVLIAHVEREVDQVLGGSKITVATLGKALAPKIPVMFSDVVLAQREGSNFTWNTIHSQADLKTRNLMLSEKIPQDFRLIIEKWRARNKAGE